jgi:hypothetical protein
VLDLSVGFPGTCVVCLEVTAIEGGEREKKEDY